MKCDGCVRPRYFVYGYGNLSVVRIVCGVTDQIIKDLAKPGGIAKYFGWNRGVDLNDDFGAFGYYYGLELILDVLYQLQQINLCLDQPQLIVLYFAEIEHIIDEAE